MVSGFVTSPDDQSRICLLDARPMRIASKSLMSIKLSPAPLSFQFQLRGARLKPGTAQQARWRSERSSFLQLQLFCQRAGLLLGLLRRGDVRRERRIGDVDERLVGGQREIPVLVDALLALLDL